MRSIDGVLRVAHSSSVDTLAIVDRFAELHPEVRVKERVIPCDAQLAGLREREIDVAVCRLASAPPADCHVELVRLDPILAAVILSRMLEDVGAAARELTIETMYELRDGVVSTRSRAGRLS